MNNDNWNDERTDKDSGKYEKLTPEERYGTERPEPADIVETSKVMKWLDNFWYHNKWTVIVVTFFLAVLIIGTVQMLSREKYDITLTYGGSYRMNNAERAAFESLLDSLCPDDYDGDGDKNVQYVIYEVYSEQEIMDAKEKAEEEGAQFVLNTKYNQEEFSGFNSFVMTGESSVYIVSPYLYGQLYNGGRLKDLGEIYSSEKPQGILDDGHGVRLGDTDFYKYNAEAQVLSPDAVIRLLSPTVWGKSHDDEIYAQSVEFFDAIVSFDVIE